jgi:rhodanese-related sulfurtransferase
MFGEDMKKKLTIFKDLQVKDSVLLIKDNSKNPDFIILDVRTKNEFKEGHLENALNMDFYFKDFSDQLDSLDKNKKYFLYCRSGNRSGKTSEIMKRLGFTEVYNLLGGFSDLEKNGLKTVK